MCIGCLSINKRQLRYIQKVLPLSNIRQKQIRTLRLLQQTLSTTHEHLQFLIYFTPFLGSYKQETKSKNKDTESKYYLVQRKSSP